MIGWLRKWGLTTLVVVFVVLSCCGIWAAYFSNWFALRSIVVLGNVSVSKEEVAYRLGISPGEPLMRVDVDDARARVEGIRVVERAKVERKLPHTLQVTIVERSPIAFVAKSEGAHLVDSAGVDFSTVPQAPEGLPELEVPRIAVDNPVTKAALGVLTHLPETLRAQVTKVSAQTELDVSVTLAAGGIVIFGSSEDVERKSQVVLVLLSQEAAVYNVSNPGAPVLSR